MNDCRFLCKRGNLDSTHFDDMIGFGLNQRVFYKVPQTWGVSRVTLGCFAKVGKARQLDLGTKLQKTVGRVRQH